MTRRRAGKHRTGGSGGRFVYLEGVAHEISDTEPEAMRATVEEVWAEGTGQP